MKAFLKKVVYYFTPLAMVIALIIYIDFFKIWGFKNYYYDNFITLNREMICTKTYNHYRNEYKFNSFIFGNSRSQAFKCKKWSEYLTSDSNPFHFDASNEVLRGIWQKVRYIDNIGDTIKNALVVLDRITLLNSESRNTNHLFIPMPCLSNDSKIKYNLVFIKASLNPYFVISVVDFSLFSTYRSYMKGYIRKSKCNFNVNSFNCDIWYGNDVQIMKDSIGYYKRLIDSNIFYKRDRKKKFECTVTEPEIMQLNEIKKIFVKHNTKYKIVLSPTYDQIPIENEQLSLIQDVFGENNVYNFTGVNKHTAFISNYYEASHYRPIVANEILSIIYNH